MNISYDLSANGWHNHINLLQSLILKNNLKIVCDVGGGANPAIPLSFIKKHQLQYTLADIDAQELTKAPDQYHKVVVDFTKEAALSETYDLIFTKMVMEHVKGVNNFHTNVFKSLRPNGIAFHFFPCITTSPFLANYLIPEQLSSELLNVFAKRDRVQFDKFPAYYQWCLGPTRRNIRRFQKLGYEVCQYKGFFGHEYFKKIPSLQKLEDYKSQFLLKHPTPYLCSYAFVVLKKSL